MLVLVLKTSNSARLVLLKSNEHYAKWWWWARPHVQIHSIEISEQFCNIWRGCKTKSVARYDYQVVDRQKHVCSFCAVSEPCRSTEMSPGCSHDQCWLGFGRGTSNADTSFQHSKLKHWLREVRIFRVSADNVLKQGSFSQLVLEKVRFLLSTKECSKVEIVLVLVPALSYQA